MQGTILTHYYRSHCCQLLHCTKCHCKPCTVSLNNRKVKLKYLILTTTTIGSLYFYIPLFVSLPLFLSLSGVSAGKNPDFPVSLGVRWPNCRCSPEPQPTPQTHLSTLTLKHFLLSTSPSPPPTPQSIFPPFLISLPQVLLLFLNSPRFSLYTCPPKQTVKAPEAG